MSFYSSSKIYCFVNVNVNVNVNVSSNEGIPVSIMEATSFGIPVVVTDVGGVSEILSDKNGVLLSKNVTPEWLANSVISVCGRNSIEFRLMVRRLREKEYSAKINYPTFLKFMF